MTNSLINTQITILTYLVFGFVLYKVKMIDDQSQLFISNLTINVLLPASVFVSFFKKFIDHTHFSGNFRNDNLHIYKNSN